MSLTVSSLKNFIENPVWKEFQDEMRAMRIVVLETMVTEELSYKMFKAAGRAEVLGDLINWADVQLTNAEDDKEREEGN